MKQKISNLTSAKFHRRELRSNATLQEIILWSRLKNKQLGVKFRRQHSFGKYIADFYCPEKRLVIEIDGSQHMEQEKYDRERTHYFESLGLEVLRFWNSDVNTNIDGVMVAVSEYIEKTHPTPTLPSQEGRENGRITLKQQK
ncbi:MAG: endonuclease domain-containing protein [Candidatus Paceibacterota bacterium]|jgi:very-short-patch-repair endonuclease|nr:endonuclease domain-containing protein [Candidatus Paceibacterota bacterium]